MNVKFIKLFACLSGCLLVFGCGGIKQFSETSPFAVEMARVRSYYHAKKIESRLEKMEIPSYMVVLTDKMDQSSKWYVLLTGAEKDTIEASKILVTLDIQHKLKGLKVLNYHTVQAYLLPLDRKKIEEVENIEAVKPDLPENIYELVNKFPKNDQFNVENMVLQNFAEPGMPRQYLNAFNQTSLDLPRGISKDIIAQKAMAFAEVIYKDNLYGDRVTVDVMKLKSNHGIDRHPRARLTQNTRGTENADADHIAWYFSSLILNTGIYLTEVFEKITVSSYTMLYGYKVVIQPNQGVFRTYMVLVDMEGGFVIFSQSTDKSEAEILAYLTEFGTSNGMFDYSEFHNNFFTIPRCLEDGDVFLGYSSQVLDNSYAMSKGYADWSKAMVGHSVSNANFYNRKLKKFWSCSTFDLITSNKKDYVYNDMYRKQNARNKMPIKVNNWDGYFVEDFFSNEVNFPTAGRYVIAVGGIGMGKAALLKRAEKVQTGDDSGNPFPCGSRPPDTGPDDGGGAPGPDTFPVPLPTPTDPVIAGGCQDVGVVKVYPSSHPDYRTFQLEAKLINIAATPRMTIGKMYRQLLQEVAFVMPSDDISPVVDCKKTDTELRNYKDNPVLLRLNDQAYSVTGYSLPGHALHPCRFSRTLKEKDGQIIMVTEGETLSKRPTVIEWQNAYFWGKADRKLIASNAQ